MPELSIIIVNFRSWRSLRQCLDSLSSIPGNHKLFEVIIVDNASDDGMLTEFQLANPEFKFILNRGNNGFANGCNLGAAKAKGEYLLFLNPDTIANESALIRMMNMARTKKDTSIISCRQVKGNGREEKPYGNFLSPMSLTGWMRAMKRLISRGNNRLNPEDDFISPDWVSGSVFMIKKENFNALGGWDEDYWMYFEDVDLCRRARNAGGDVILIKDIAIEHNHGGSSRNNLKISSLTKCEVIISRHVYIAKYEAGIRIIYMQSFLVINNLITGFIPAFLGLIFFFIKSLRLNTFTYFSLIKYYFSALLHRTWLSPRSVNYRN